MWEASGRSADVDHVDIGLSRNRPVSGIIRLAYLRESNLPDEAPPKFGESPAPTIDIATSPVKMSWCLRIEW